MLEKKIASLNWKTRAHDIAIGMQRVAEKPLQQKASLQYDQNTELAEIW